MANKTDDFFLGAMIEFYNNELHHPVSKELAEYILVHHFDSFALAYSQFRAPKKEQGQALAIQIATAAASKMKA